MRFSGAMSTRTTSIRIGLWLAVAAIAAIRLIPSAAVAQTNSTTVDYLVVTPSYECTRVSPGGVGPHTAQFTAIGWNNGPNAVDQSQSGDDINLGPVTVTWESGASAYDAHSGQSALTESPSGVYGDNWNVTATTTASFDLSGASLASLEFWHHYDLENGYDYGYVEVNAGSGWVVLDTYNGTLGGLADFQYQWLNLGAYTGQTIQIRFRVDTDGSVVRDGWVIDDIVLRKDSTDLLNDDLESGLGNWAISSQWGLSLPGGGAQLGTIDANGLFTAGGATGTTFVKAVHGGTVEATATVDVYPPDWVP